MKSRSESHRACWLVLLAIILASGSSSADTITGAARVVDGDTFWLGGEKIRLLDIDAPEARQTCGEIPCGRFASLALAIRIEGREVSCSFEKRDRDHRPLAHCSVEGQPIGEAMLTDGFAIAYRTCRADGVIGGRPDPNALAIERRARAARAGLWGLDRPPVNPYCFRHPGRCGDC